MQERVPFAVVGSNRVMEVNGRKVRGRQYPWGLVEVDNLQHNDFLALRDMLIRYEVYPFSFDSKAHVRGGGLVAQYTQIRMTTNANAEILA